MAVKFDEALADRLGFDKEVNIREVQAQWERAQEYASSAARFLVASRTEKEGK